MTRSLPAALSPVVAALELDQIELVDTSTLADLIEQTGVETPINVVVQRLSARGWLLPTGVRRVYEFAPGSHAGPVGRGDPFTRLRAQLLVSPDLIVRVALASALWLHGLADRAPEPKHELSVPTGTTAPVALRRRYRVVHHDPALPPSSGNPVPVDRPATILAHVATRPTAVRSWHGLLNTLPDLIAAADPDEIGTEIAGRGHAAAARLSYLLDATTDSTLRDRFAVEMAGKVWFGPRGRLRRHDAPRNIADTLLPAAPVEVRR